MKRRNEILKKIPILLPYFYVQRLFVAIFKKRDLAINSITGLDKFNEEYSKKVSVINTLRILDGGYGITVCDDEIYERSFLFMVLPVRMN